jgi:hypothetical protein
MRHTPTHTPLNARCLHSLPLSKPWASTRFEAPRDKTPNTLKNLNIRRAPTERARAHGPRRTVRGALGAPRAALTALGFGHLHFLQTTGPKLQWGRARLLAAQEHWKPSASPPGRRCIQVCPAGCGEGAGALACCQPAGAAPTAVPLATTPQTWLRYGERRDARACHRRKLHAVPTWLPRGPQTRCPAGAPRRTRTTREAPAGRQRRTPCANGGGERAQRARARSALASPPARCGSSPGLRPRQASPARRGPHLASAARTQSWLTAWLW